MSDSDIQVILNELKNIKDDIADIKTDIKDKCKNCVNFAVTDEKLKNQNRHIAALWAALVFLATAFGGPLINHIFRK